MERTQHLNTNRAENLLFPDKLLGRVAVAGDHLQLNLIARLVVWHVDALACRQHAQVVHTYPQIG